MKLHVENGDYGTVRDADGLFIPDCIGCDTETGEVLQHARGENGQYLLFGEKIVTRTVRYKAPLLYEPPPKITITNYKLPITIDSGPCAHDWRQSRKGKWCSKCGAYNNGEDA